MAEAQIEAIQTKGNGAVGGIDASQFQVGKLDSPPSSDPKEVVGDAKIDKDGSITFEPLQSNSGEPKKPGQQDGPPDKPADSTKSPTIEKPPVTDDRSHRPKVYSTPTDKDRSNDLMHGPVRTHQRHSK